MAGKIYQTERDIVNKLSVLEYVVGFQDYSLFTPSRNFQSSDIVSIQKEATRMLNHLHLEDYLAVISYTTEEPNTGGHIELNDADDSNNIFINISIDYKGHDAVVLCVMAHEICHKLLHIRKFKGNTTDENEVFTDLAAVYSGFGRLILNGCHDEWETSEIVPNGTRTVKHTIEVGYLDIRDYAFAYVMMGMMYGVPTEVFTKGLSTYADSFVCSMKIPPLQPSEFDQEIIKVKQEYGNILRDINLLEDGLNGVKNRIRNKLIKLDYVPDVRSQTGFNKPITAYSLLIEPLLQGDASRIQSLRETLSCKVDIRQLKTIFCPYCGKQVDIPSSLSEARYLKFKCFSCGKDFIVGMNCDEPAKRDSAAPFNNLAEKRRSFF